MNNLLSIIAIFVALLALVLVMTNRQQVRVLKQQLNQFSTTTAFTLQSLDSGRSAYDSVIFYKDTAFFYRKGEFQGKMFTSSESKSSVIVNYLDALKKEWQKRPGK